MSQIIIYGAGKKGKWCLEFLKWRGMEEMVYAFCDEKYAELKEIDGKSVISYEMAKQCNLPIVIAIAKENCRQEIYDKMKKDGKEVYTYDEMHVVLGEEKLTFLREWCGYHHDKNNNKYFDDAEKQDSLNVFWNDNSPFYCYFRELDLSNIIELACGRGRHVQKYLDDAEKITLVDIVENNIKYCKERYKDNEKITYYCNNGYNLEKLPDETYTALFTYDAIVHFELIDIYEYLKDIYRVLKPEAKALFHHSNYSADYKVDFTKNKNGRSFMSKDIFAYLANRAGFSIVDQKVIDWYGEKSLDCITLLQK